MQEIKASRRNLFLGGAAALAGSALPAQAPRSMLAPRTRSLNTVDRALSILSSRDDSFAALLDRHYPGLANDGDFSNLLPLAALLTHEGGPGVRAHTVVWSLHSASGLYEASLFRYARPGVRRKSKKGKTVVSGQQNLMSHSQVRLVTPFFTLSPKLYRSLGPSWTSLITSKSSGKFLVSEAPKATHIDIYLDAVVYKDRKVLGPDKYGLAKRLTARRNAEHDIARGALKMLKAGQSDAEVQQALSASGSVLRSSEAGSKGYYQQAKRQHAQVLLKHFSFVGREEFTKTVQRAARIRKTKLVTLTAV